MANAIEILTSLRKEKADLIDQCRREIEGLEHDIQALSGVIDGIDESIKAIQLKEGVTPQTPSNATSKYVGKGLTECVLDIVQRQGDPPGLLVPQIVKQLETEGFKSGAKRLYENIYSVGIRLVRQGKIKEGKIDGKRSFMRKEPF